MILNDTHPIGKDLKTCLDWLSVLSERGTRLGRLTQNDIVLKPDMAERVGFEPTVRVNVHTLSKRAP
jgi:hypothetical protein